MRQTTKSLWTLVGLLAVAAALGLYAYFGVEKGDQREQERKETSELLFGLRQPGERGADGGAFELELTKVSVSRQGETTVLERDTGGQWMITSPVQAKADRLAVESLLSQIQTAKTKAKVEESPDQAALAKYGLKAPSFSVAAQGYVPDAQGGGKEDPARRRQATIQGGVENTFDGSVYVRKEGDPAVYSAPGGVRWSLEKSTFDLRDKEVLAMDEAKLRSIEVKAKTNSYALERSAKKSWKLLRPKALAADSSTISTMLNALRAERALSFPKDTPEERKGLGLESPETEATFTLESGEKLRLRFARKAEKAYLLREDGADAVLAEVGAGSVAALDKSPSELKDRSVLSFDKEQVAKIAFRLASGSEVLVERELTDAGAGEEWKVTAPRSGPAKKWKLSSLLWSLGSLRSAEVGEANPKSWEKYGVGPRSRGVSLYGRDGGELGRLWLGKDVQGKSGVSYARGSKDEVMEIDSSRLSDLPATIEDVLDLPAADGG